MTFNERSSWLNLWWAPFLWITVTPIVTVPLSALLFYVLAGYHEAQEVGLPAKTEPGWLDFGYPTSGSPYTYFEVIPTLIAFTLPGLLNVAPFFWILSRNGRVKIAGLAAGLLGLLRLCVPALIFMLFYDRVANAAGTPYFEQKPGFFDTPAHLEAWIASAVAWFGTVVIWAAFGVVNRGSWEVPWLIGIAGGMLTSGLVLGAMGFGFEQGIPPVVVLLLVAAVVVAIISGSRGSRGHGF